MQPSELVTEMAARLREELRKHDLWATEAVALAVAEAVALDFYERGLREAAEMVNAHAYDEDDCEISEISWLAKAILSKLRSAT